MRFPEYIRTAPFVRILPPLAAGILAAGWVRAPAGIVIAVTAVVYTAAWRLRNTPASQWHLPAALFLTGILLTLISAIPEIMPRGEKLAVTVRIEQEPFTKGRWTRTQARVGYFRGIRDTVWQTTREQIELYIDTTHSVRSGEELTVTGYLNPIDTTGSRYGALMRSRGISARMFVTATGVIARMPGQNGGIRHYASEIHRYAVSALSRLHLSPENRSMVTALVAGDKRGIPPETKNAYSKTGTAHILAVSGLHMGFVLLLVNLLFGWTAVLRRGHRIKNLLVIPALWLYAAMSGFSPSVIRAAIMLTAVQVALFSSSRADSYNIVFGTATLMLAVHPFYLYDISFQLSFIAVLGILFLYPRLYRRKLGRNKITDSILSSLLVSAAAQAAVMPLIVYNFGNVPLIALFINPVVILTAFVAIGTGLLWVALPLPFLDKACSTILTHALELQNGIVTQAARIPGAAVENIPFSGTAAIAAYTIMAALCIGIKLREDKKASDPPKGLSVPKKSRIFAPR